MTESNQRMPTVRFFAPEQWGEVDRFQKFYAGTYCFSTVQKRALGGVSAHLEKAIILQSLAVKLVPNLQIDEDQLKEKGFTPAENTAELATVIEALMLELYSSVDCCVKVLHAIYGVKAQGFKSSTRKFFQSYRKISGDFPDFLKDIIGSVTWYNELLFLRDELTHLSTGNCHRSSGSNVVGYMHMGIKVRGKVFVINDIFEWIENKISEVNAFLGAVFNFLNSTLKDIPTQQICGFVEGRVLLRMVSPAEPLTFNSGHCVAYKWFELEEQPSCPFAKRCGAYQRKWVGNL